MTLTNRRIEVSVGRTVNLGNYESERIDIALGGDMTDDMHLKENVDELYYILSGMLEEKIKRLRKG